MKAASRNSVVGTLTACIIAVGLVWFGYSFLHAYDRVITPERTLQIGGATLHVAVADTPQERERGLSGITRLANDEGMLFIFHNDDQYSFWMKDMHLSIDMIWISSAKTPDGVRPDSPEASRREGRVVYIKKSVSPDTFPEAFTPDTPARYVLEVPAGFSDAHGIQKGTEVAF